VPVSHDGGTSSTGWTQVSAASGVGFSFNDYDSYAAHGGQIMARICLVFADSSGGASMGSDSTFKARVSKRGGSDVYYNTQVGGTWSGSGLVHHDCGQWVPASDFSACGYGWGSTCKIEIQHGQGVHVVLHEADIEISLQNHEGSPNEHYVGRMNLPVAWNGVVPQNGWEQISHGHGVGFTFSDYNDYIKGSDDVLMVRLCAHFSDSSGDPSAMGASVARFRIRKADYSGPGQNTYHEMAVGATWSGSGLIHHDCGEWVPASDLSNCGYGWGNTCEIDVGHGQNVNVNVHELDLEISVQGHDTAADKVYVGRFDMPISFEGVVPTDTFVKINTQSGVGFSFDDYSQYVTSGKVLLARVCASYSDSSGAASMGASEAKFRISKMGGGAVYYAGTVGATWSGSGLIHHDCGEWVPASDLSPCGYGWGSTCVIEVGHGQNVNVKMFEAELELAVADQ
jgi:hypothetical protein